MSKKNPSLAIRDRPLTGVAAQWNIERTWNATIIACKCTFITINCH
jgi:hypothetical protein